MIHYTCDRCHREIESELEVRYSIQIESKAVFEIRSDMGAEQDEDHLMELHEVLERLEDEPQPTRDPLCLNPACPTPTRQCHHFDLCSDCYKVYSRNPLARDTPLSIEFSEN